MALARARTHHTLRFDLRYLVAAISHGPRPRECEASAIGIFEARFARHLGADHCIAFGYARTAVYATLAALGLSSGDEVILPPITIKAMVDAVTSLGLRPVFVDIDPDSLIFDADALEAAITPRTRAVLLTYLFGIAADPRRVVAACRARGIVVIEDFSHNLGATNAGRACGTFGDVGVYSASATKALDAFGGGLAVTDDPRLAASLREAQAALVEVPRWRLASKVFLALLYNVGTRPFAWSLWAKLRPPTEASTRRLPGADRRQPLRGALAPRAFERWTALQARAANELLAEVDPSSARRRLVAEQIRAALRAAGAQVPAGCAEGVHVYWQTIAVAADPTAVRRVLAAHGVDSGTTNLSLVSDVGESPDSAPACPVARRVKERGLYLPAHQYLTRSQRRQVRRAIDAVGRSVGWS